MSPSLALRHRTLFEDPARFLCLCAALSLWLVPSIPFGLLLLVLLSLQAGAVRMAVRAARPGWSWEGGGRIHPAVYASSLTSDYAGLAAGTVAGALLLVRLFNGPGPVGPLAAVAVGVCLLPDIRLCRSLLPRDPAEASRELSEGACFRDPVVIGTALAATGMLVVDRHSLTYLMASLVLFQAGPLLVFMDQYLPEADLGRRGGWRALLGSRDVRRLLLPVAALGLAPLRLAGGEPAAWTGTGLLALVAAWPDLVRMGKAAALRAANLLRVTPVAGR